MDVNGWDGELSGAAAEEAVAHKSGGRKKKKNKKTFNQTEYRRSVNKRMADGIRDSYEEVATVAAAAAAEEEGESPKRRGAGKHHPPERSASTAHAEAGVTAVEATEPRNGLPARGSLQQLSLPSTPSPNGPASRHGETAAAPTGKRATSFMSLPSLRSPTQFFGKAFGGGGGSAASTPSNASTPSRRVFRDPGARRPPRPGWTGPGRGFAHAVVIVLLKNDKVKDKVRRKRAARVVQKNVRLKLLLPIMRRRAAIVIQRNFRIYREWLISEKWRIVAKQKRRNDKERHRKIKELQKKKEQRRATQMVTNRKKMERQAIAAGCWDPTVQDKQAKGWSSHDVAIMVALKYGHGLPTSDESWEVFEDEFPKKKRSELSKFLNKLKDSGEIDNHGLLDELTPEENRRLIPGM